MKKTILTILLCGVLVLGLTGCGNNNNKETSNSEKENVKVEEKEKVNKDEKYKDMERVDLSYDGDRDTYGFSVTLGYKKGTDWKIDSDMNATKSSLTLISENHKMRVELNVDCEPTSSFEGNLAKYKEQNKEGMFNEFTANDGYKGFYRYDYNGVQKDMLVGSLRLDEVSTSSIKQVGRVNFKVYRANGVASERIDVVKDFVIAELFNNLTFEIDD